MSETVVVNKLALAKLLASIDAVSGSHTYCKS